MEVMAVATVNGDGVAALTIAARGNEGAVPALLPYMEKGDVVIHNHPSGDLRPSTADLRVASHLGNQGIGFYIVDNECANFYAVAEPVQPTKLQLLDPDALGDVLEPGGAFDKRFEDYEARDSQIAMAKMVARGFNEDQTVVAEAGTGVGKSMAYLIPTLRWVDQNEERVVISTATINLQTQLVDKDIPLAKVVLGSDAKVALVKGRGNYLCQRRLQEAIDEATMFDEELDDLHAIAEWAKNSKTGEKSDLAFLPDPALWGKVCSEADSCQGLRCAKREGCFLLKARREAAAAKVLVVNHHLLFADLAMRVEGAGFDNTAVLPPFHRLVFDEAHNVETSATSFFSADYQKHFLLRPCHRLYGTRRGKTYGVALLVRRLVGDHPKLDEIPGLVADVRSRVETLETLTAELLGNESTYRFTPLGDNPIRRALLESMTDLHTRVLDIVDVLTQVRDSAEDDVLEEQAMFEMAVIQRRLSAAASVFEFFKRREDHPERVFWIERARTSAGETYYRYLATPLEIGDMMKEAVYEPYDTVIFTSATLSIREDFAFWLRRVGLWKEDARTASFPSPFPYKERVLLAVPSDGELPSAAGYQDYVSRTVEGALKVSEGKALVLFTSYGMLRETFDRVEPELRDLGITVMRQGDDDRSRLLNRFRNDTASVLFATNSFWEGVDTPGEALELVIICRLPFSVPTNPVVQARVEAVEARGGNAFMEISIPEAVMRFKQGFGRLMRRKEDRGAVLILDGRVIRKRYGALFLESLPETMRSVKPIDGVLADMERFYYG
jgi:ATP-dependent DNA helicase DinG